MDGTGNFTRRWTVIWTLDNVSTLQAHLLDGLFILSVSILLVCGDNILEKLEIMMEIG